MWSKGVVHKWSEVVHLWSVVGPQVTGCVGQTGLRLSARTPHKGCRADGEGERN
jgi:hypothetical protein